MHHLSTFFHHLSVSIRAYTFMYIRALRGKVPLSSELSWKFTTHDVMLLHYMAFIFPCTLFPTHPYKYMHVHVGGTRMCIYYKSHSLALKRLRLPLCIGFPTSAHNRFILRWNASMCKHVLRKLKIFEKLFFTLRVHA